MQYNFEWDPRKAKANITKHVISFEQAAEVFLDALQLRSLMVSTARLKSVG